MPRLITTRSSDVKTTSSKNNKAGFTLVELMVVAVIVAILAAVAIPLMSANKKRAISTEAESALGTIRSALRAQYAETGAYNVTVESTGAADLSNGDPATALPGISAGTAAGNGEFGHQTLNGKKGLSAIDIQEKRHVRP